MKKLLLLLAFACPAFAAPPKLTLPAEVKATGDYVVVSPETDAVSVVYVLSLIHI